MGKASSNKKVARAAGTGGGRTAGASRPWKYYSVIALVVVLGLAGTLVSRNNRTTAIASAGTTAPAVGGTPWNEALGVYVCGKFLPNITTTKDPYGITTQGDGIIRIHPFVKSAAGRNATLGKFASSVGVQLNAAALQLPGGHLYRDGDSCNGKPAHVYVKQFAYVGDPSGVVQTTDPSKVLLADQQMLTVAFVSSADKAAVPAPPSAVQAALKKLAAAATSTTTTPGTPVPGATTVPGASTVPGATTVPGVKTVPGATTGSPASTSPASTSPASTSPASTSPAGTSPATGSPATGSSPATSAPSSSATTAPG